jgi:hypothetical protein
VQKMHEEFGVLKAYMLAEKFLDERVAAGREELRLLLRRQYQELKSKYERFQIFIAIERCPQLQAQLMERLPESRQFVQLAKEFAAEILRESLPTVNEAWFQFPKVSKTPKIETT